MCSPRPSRAGRQPLGPATYRERRGWAAKLDIEWVKGDILDRESLRAAFAGADVVYHLAALVSIESGRAGELQTINVGARATSSRPPSNAA